MKRSKSFDGKNPVLFLIATPIGNLQEFSSRALDTINDMDLIACEDTRNTAKLLSFFNIHKPLISLREHNEVEASNQVISRIKNGEKIAYVSDAGYPTISDPGNILARLAKDNDISVSVINGSSAFLSALVASGLPTNHFYFHGFLPAKENEAKTELKSLQNKTETLIFYESPHRIDSTLKILYEILGEREAVIARELTKINEEFIRGNLSEFVEIDPSTLKGEMVIIVAGNNKTDEVSLEEVEKRINELLSSGIDKKNTTEIILKEFNIRKNIVKDIVLKSSSKLK